MKNILITGANRGVGLALTSFFSKHHNTKVIAACRKPGQAPELNTLADMPRHNIKIVRLDVDDPGSIDHCIAALSENVDSLYALINNAGIFGGSVADPRPVTSQFGSLAMNEMLEVFRTNAVAPVLMAQACAHLLKKRTGSRIINMSSDAGSITLRENKGNYSYMASKAALNMMTRCVAAELRDDGIIVVSMHPGFLQTDMGGPNAPMRIDETIPTLVRQIEDLSMADSGRFINWDGSPIPW